jgi:hypothetical protein
MNFWAGDVQLSGEHLLCACVRVCACVVLGIKSRVILGKCSTTELYPQPLFFVFIFFVLF